MHTTLRLLNKLIFKTFFRLKVEGKSNISSGDPFILVANHNSLLDGCILASTIKRPITFLSASFLFEKPFVGWFLKRVGAIPVQKHGQNLASLKRALEVLAGGGIIGIFPEGGIYESDLYFGAAYLGVKSGAPLLPASIIGADKALPIGQRWPGLKLVWLWAAAARTVLPTSGCLKSWSVKGSASASLGFPK